VNTTLRLELFLRN